MLPQPASKLPNVCFALQVLNPELGRLESRVHKFYLNELFNDTGPDLEETAYWFHVPPGAPASHLHIRLLAVGSEAFFFMAIPGTTEGQRAGCTEINNNIQQTRLLKAQTSVD